MKLSFSYINSIGGFLSVTTVATLLLGYYSVGAIGWGTARSAIAPSAAPEAIANTTQNLAQIAALTPESLYGFFGSTSGVSLQQDRTSILHLDRETAVCESLPDPLPPIPDKSGGSSYSDHYGKNLSRAAFNSSISTSMLPS